MDNSLRYSESTIEGYNIDAFLERSVFNFWMILFLYEDFETKIRTKRGKGGFAPYNFEGPNKS